MFGVGAATQLSFIALLKVCDWEGISCAQDNQTVIAIELPSADLLASIPSTLGLLTDLKRINLQQNLLYGPIPTDLAALPDLMALNLGENQLKGNLPSFKSEQLRRLVVSHNALVGSLPPDFGEVNKDLRYIDIQYNRLTGYLPYGLEDLDKLQTISMSKNSFSGTLPPYLGNMEQLKFLYLDNNEFVGTIPTSWRGNGVNSTIREIWLQGNLLSGTIPATLSELSRTIRDLYVDGNKLTGSVPQDLCMESINADFFANLPPNTDRNFCDSLTCPPHTVSDSGVFPCYDCESTIDSPYLGQTGTCKDLTESEILARLVKQSESIDVQETACLYEGVVCDSSQRHVIEIDFHGRGLTGTIPDELGLLPHLTELDLSDNELTGFLPSGLRFAPLTKLDVSGNKLKGIVPPLLCLKDGINGDGDNRYGCTHIACPIGTYSANRTGYGDCRLCPEGGKYLASKYCLPLDVRDDDVVVPAPAPHSNDLTTTYALAALFIVSALFVAAFGLYLFAQNREKRMLSMWSSASRAEYEGMDYRDRSSFPHSEEVKLVIPPGTLRGGKDKKKKPRRASWLEKQFNRSYHYLVSLTETETVRDPPGVKPRKVTEGEIDDYGWQEREAILERRDLERTVALQRQSSKTNVWEYPDPLECANSYGNKSGGTSFDSSDSQTMEDLTTWFRKQDSQNSKEIQKSTIPKSTKDDEKSKSKEVWLDVPDPN